MAPLVTFVPLSLAQCCGSWARCWMWKPATCGEWRARGAACAVAPVGLPDAGRRCRCCASRSLVTELCERNLEELLHSSAKLDWHDRISIALDIARGSAWLHSEERSQRSTKLLVLPARAPLTPVRRVRVCCTQCATFTSTPASSSVTSRRAWFPHLLTRRALVHASPLSQLPCACWLQRQRARRRAQASQDCGLWLEPQAGAWTHGDVLRHTCHDGTVASGTRFEVQRTRVCPTPTSLTC